MTVYVFFFQFLSNTTLLETLAKRRVKGSKCFETVFLAILAKKFSKFQPVLALAGFFVY